MTQKLIKIFSLIFKISIILSSVFLVSVIVFSFKNKNEIIWIDSTIEEISKKNDYIEIIKLNDKFLEIEGKTCNSYLLKIKDDNILLDQPFGEKKYTRNNELDLLNDKSKLNKICDLLANTNKGVPGSQLVEMTNSDNSLYKISKIALEIANNLDNKISEIHLYVKGYADKSRTDWKDKLDKKYHYQDIPYYISMDKFNEKYIISNENINLHKITDDYYVNSDLPFLRSKYVEDNYLSYLQGCSNKITKTGILEGRIINENLEKMRTTEIYISACYLSNQYSSCASHN
ncbi:hypothetical protein [Thiothrix winogradskyi]|uniref:Uncharacterized protein n=1 Tax=Thiothrix winogradskyi TaxID=96472 RepID=A0ABY3SZX8_9GAMM|nr:hypothetical protein [Thiothrix winogradskyi]UJS24708.1 hypothetical protein L2Y54_01345 [Thiothrix winogradskyi]